MIKRLSENKALAQLQRLKSAYQRFIKINYEHAAESCKSCLTPGACCTDEHWVNVRITRLEAVAIHRTLEQTPRWATRIGVRSTSGRKTQYRSTTYVLPPPRNRLIPVLCSINEWLSGSSASKAGALYSACLLRELAGFAAGTPAGPHRTPRGPAEPERLW